MGGKNTRYPEEFKNQIISPYQKARIGINSSAALMSNRDGRYYVKEFLH